MKIKTLYDKLQPEVKSALQANARKYDTAKRLKYVLMSKTNWQELNISTVNDILTFGDVNSSSVSTYGFLYGANIIKQ